MEIPHLRDLFRRKSSLDERKELKPKLSFLGFHSDEVPLADTPSLTSDPNVSLSFNLRGGYRVKVKKGVKEITLFRFLLAKLVYDDVDGLHLDEYLVLNELYFNNLLSKTDPSFVKKYGEWLVSIQPFLQAIAGARQFPARLTKMSHTEQIYVQFLEPYLPSKNAFFGLRGNRDLRRSWALILNNALPPQRKLDKRVIGVGYKDKGARKDPHEGSPDWKEVATHFTEIQRQIIEGERPENEAPPWLLQEIERESEE